jgi:hypothetical protein
MGNPNRLPDEHHETFEGRDIDPRFQKGMDPTRDPRFDTNLNSAMVPPKNLGGALRVLLIVLAAVLFVLLIVLMFWRFQMPSPRSPQPQSRVEPMVLTRDVLLEGSFVLILIAPKTEAIRIGHTSRA